MWIRGGGEDAYPQNVDNLLFCFYEPFPLGVQSYLHIFAAIIILLWWPDLLQKTVKYKCFPVYLPYVCIHREEKKK